MNERLRLALEKVELLPDDAQDEIALMVEKAAAKKRILARVAASEARGGSTAHEEVFAELKRKHGF